MQLELGPDDDHGAAGIIDALAEKVLAEAALLAFQHIGEGFQRALVRSRDDAAAPPVVEQRIDRFLQHALLVADDDVGSLNLDETLQAVVAVDHAAIEIIEIGGRETAAVERHRGAADRVESLALAVKIIHSGLLPDWMKASMILSLRISFLGFSSEVVVAISWRRSSAIFGKSRLIRNLANGLGADEGGEGILAILLLGTQHIVLGEELILLQRREAGLDDDVVLEIENALDVLQRHVEQEPDARRQGLQEPDMGDGSRELDMAHALAPHPRQRDLDAAFLADDALVFHALVLAAQALVVLDRAEDARAEKAVTLRLESPIIDRLGFLISPNDQDLIFSGLASAIRMRSNATGCAGWLKMLMTSWFIAISSNLSRAGHTGQRRENWCHLSRGAKEALFD